MVFAAKTRAILNKIPTQRQFLTKQQYTDNFEQIAMGLQNTERYVAILQTKQRQSGRKQKTCILPKPPKLVHTVPVCNAFDKNDYRHIKKGFAKILGNVNGFANKQLGVVKMTSCKEPPYYVNCDGFLHESNQHTNQGHEYSTTNKRLIFLPYLQLITFHYQT